MNQKDKRYILEKVFESGIDGGSNNAFASIHYYLEHNTPVNAYSVDVSIGDIKSVLYKLSKKWDKEIDKFI
jgi:hypothetical protein